MPSACKPSCPHVTLQRAVMSEAATEAVLCLARAHSIILRACGTALWVTAPAPPQDLASKLVCFGRPSPYRLQFPYLYFLQLTAKHC